MGMGRWDFPCKINPWEGTASPFVTIEAEVRLVVPRRKFSIRKWILFGILGLFSLCIVAVAGLYVSNLNLPTQSSQVERLTELEKARLEEATHLRESLGNEIWPGWGEVDIPYIVYNEKYAFLVGYQDPPAGWVMEPRKERRGGPWEQVPNDPFVGSPYYRQLLLDANKTPENFTVRVGERWAATLQTKEYSFIQFVKGFGEDLPPVIRDVFPYRLIWKPLGGDSEAIIAGLLHESFHSHQGMVAYDHFVEAENLAPVENRYPWEDEPLKEAWRIEFDILADVAGVNSREEALELARRFLEQRDKRRAMPGMDAELVDFERQREWLEGLAKYAELSITRLAKTDSGYAAILALEKDPEFHDYASRERFWKQQFQELKRMSNRYSEIRFYYTGMAQATLLDWIIPDWKSQAMESDSYLEDLLRSAIMG
jgi:hypothetical protein